jgi:ethanolamine utilization protein EutN
VIGIGASIVRIAEIIGRVTLSKVESSVAGSRWLVGVPLDHDGINGAESGRGEPLVIYDDLGAGIGSLIAFSEGGEAAAPFYPDAKPLDAYCAAILDHLDVEPTPRKQRDKTLFD